MCTQENKRLQKLYLAFLRGYKPREIAEILNIPYSLVEKAYTEWKKLREYGERK